MWAITPKGVGESVSSRRIRPGFELNTGETFVSDIDPDGMVLAADEISLEPPSASQILQEIASNLVGEAWAEAERRMNTAVVPVTTTAGTFNYGVDAETRENLAGFAQIVAQIQLGNLPQSACPNPRPFTPKGSAPINVTNAEFPLIAATVAGGKDAIIQEYFTKKAWIKDPARTMAELESYDVTSNWPL